MKKLGIVGASYLQEPLIQRAKKKGIETHVFAWAAGDVGEKSADYFYPISTTEKEEILEKCREVGIDGICTISSDLAVIAVNYVAAHMGLVGNSLECTAKSTNKHLMRQCFKENNLPSTGSFPASSASDLEGISLKYPVIVKPLDRSGSRGITKVESFSGLEAAIETAKKEGFEKKALVEEFISGKEYSVEYISWQGKHRFLALTEKFTTGAPGYIETAHFEPAEVDPKTLERIKDVVTKSLDALGIEYGASHSELKVDEAGNIGIIEIGGRMGGDCIGSDLVELTTGYDFLEAVIDIALGKEPKEYERREQYAAVRFILTKDDMDIYERIKKNNPELIIKEDVHEISGDPVTQSGDRSGYFIIAGNDKEQIRKYLPD
ncbi:MAG: ATP-grasp domain-containing protein [Lachnospiraceae bacterium]|nr:ATP-grasp domain-containing protein [Lachnospiraceae bacterium]